MLQIEGKNLNDIKWLQLKPGQELSDSRPIFLEPGQKCTEVVVFEVFGEKIMAILGMDSSDEQIEDIVKKETEKRIGKPFWEIWDLLNKESIRILYILESNQVH